MIINSPVYIVQYISLTLYKVQKF